MIVLCFAGLKSFSQTSDIMVEEKASNWIKITAPTPSRATTVKKKVSPNKPATPKQDAQEEFQKTNQQVNRFKKGKKA